jgi:glutamate-ammonia-ligase adenylyltransferase
MRDYYNNRAEAWERLALVGVRPVAGDKVFGDKVTEAIEEFIYAKDLPPEAIEKIAAIRERIVAEKVKPGVFDIKFGRGGLIEIEFICQILHMTHHKKDEARRTADPFTITTIRRAKKEGWLDRKKCAALEKAYMVYRSIEDALRMDRAQSVNVAPTTGHGLVRIARRAAIPGVGPERFVETVKDNMAEVRAIYETFISQQSA